MLAKQQKLLLSMKRGQTVPADGMLPHFEREYFNIFIYKCAKYK
jgi:hypothetical protein